MSGPSVQQPDYEEQLDPEKIFYGIFRHDNPESDPATSSPRRLGLADNWDQAYYILRNLARQQLDKNVHWGGTREVVSHNMVEYMDSSNKICLRYEIDTIVETDRDQLQKPIYTRRRDLSQPTEEHNAPMHYGMFVDLDVDKPQQKQTAFISGFESFGEAKHGMIMSAKGYMKKHKGVRMVEEHRVQVLGLDGEVEREYRLEQGRFMQGAFMSEEDWRNGFDNPFTPKPVLRLPTPTQQVAQPPSQEASSPQAAQPQQTGGVVAAKKGVELWCICRRPDDGSAMIGCENEKDCPVQWFHLSCIGMKRKPPKKEPWWCDECRSEGARAKKVDKGKGKRQD